MGSIPVLKPAEICRLLERLGFVAVRDIVLPLLRQIARDIGLTVEELISHR